MENPSEFQIPVNSIRTPFIDPLQKSFQKTHEITSNPKKIIQITIFPTSTSGSPRIFAAVRLHGGRGPRAAPGHRLAGALGALRAAARLSGCRACRGREAFSCLKSG